MGNWGTGLGQKWAFTFNFLSSLSARISYFLRLAHFEVKATAGVDGSKIAFS